ncbi:MAG TPA: hypothetical protein VN181_11305 [Thermoanaerobaculia bacterium]|nr:hypothetical protein [Thermoanaerobaculia bacterium]
MHRDGDSQPVTKPGRWLALLALVALFAFSEHLAFNRIFQVDELEGVFTARLLATGHLGEFDAGPSLMHIGPMTWIAGSTDRSALMLRMERLLFFVLFWLNLVLIVRCAGFRLRSMEGLVALLLAATLAPLWDYGFEMRHETPLLTAILLTWSFARPLAGTQRLFLVGLLCVLAQFVAHKAFAYMIPIALFAIVAAKLEENRLLRGILMLAAGGASGLAIAKLLLWLAGMWTRYASDAKSLAAVAVETQRFSAAPTLQRLLFQTPLLLVAVAAALVYAVMHAREQRITSRDSLLPEVALLAGAIAAILANPTPFPYNLVLLVPQAAILCLRLPRPTAKAWKSAFAVLFVLHVAIWFAWTRRHIITSNERQIELMETAEELTDAREHRVFDGAALVPTRFPPGRNWLIHTFTIAQFRNGGLPSIRSQLAEGRTPVIIPNYRVMALPPEDHQYMHEHYVALAGDFLVAGGAVNRSNGYRFECLVAGRYFHSGEKRVVVLARGPHTFTSDGYVVWLGPKLDAPPALGPGDASRILVNWY